VRPVWQVSFDQALTKWLLVDVGSPIDAADLDAIFLVYDENHLIIVTDFRSQSS
jgi:hypothetical protein